MINTQKSQHFLFCFVVILVVSDGDALVEIPRSHTGYPTSHTGSLVPTDMGVPLRGHLRFVVCGLLCGLVGCFSLFESSSKSSVLPPPGSWINNHQRRLLDRSRHYPGTCFFIFIFIFYHTSQMTSTLDQKSLSHNGRGEQVNTTLVRGRTSNYRKK